MEKKFKKSRKQSRFAVSPNRASHCVKESADFSARISARASYRLVMFEISIYAATAPMWLKGSIP